MPSVEILVVGLGASLLLFGVGWWQASRRDAERMIRTALSDPDPATRVAAISLVGQRGLAPFARVLLERVWTETDPEVVWELVTCVARHQWEPLDTRALVELRMVAVRILQEDARMQALVAPGERITSWGRDGAVVGDVGATRGREFASAATDALGEPIVDLRLEDPDGEILVVACGAERSASASTTSPVRAAHLADRLRVLVEAGPWV